MKRLFIILIIALCYNISNQAQTPTPEKVHSIVKIYKDYKWYDAQSQAWEKELAKNNKNADGWLSYYTATRMAKILAPEPDIRNQWLDKMEKVVTEMKTAIPNTYEYYYIQSYHNLADSPEAIKYALKAYEMNPTRADVYDELVSYYEWERNKEKMVEICTKWKASGDISPTLLLWNYNMLTSTEKDALLITFGDNDSYPSWVLQYAENVRKDVFVLNSSLLLKAKYRGKVFKELNIPEIDTNDCKNPNKIIEHIILHKGERPLYFPIAGNYSQLDIQDKLFNVGLAMRYSENGENSTSLLIRNFENNILLDHLTCAAYPEQFPSEVSRYNLLYVPGLLMLHKHYALTQKVSKQQKIKNLILKLSEQSPQQKEAIEKTLLHHETLLK